MTRENRRTRRLREDEYDDEEDPKHDLENSDSRRRVTRLAGQPPHRRWPMRLAMFVGLLAAATWYARRSSSRAACCKKASTTARSGCRAEWRSARRRSAGCRPVELRDVVVYDAQNTPVISVAGATSQKTLFGLASNAKSPGTLRLDKPRLQLVCAKTAAIWKTCSSRSPNRLRRTNPAVRRPARTRPGDRRRNGRNPGRHDWSPLAGRTDHDVAAHAGRRLAASAAQGGSGRAARHWRRRRHAGRGSGVDPARRRKAAPRKSAGRRQGEPSA